MLASSTADLFCLHDTTRYSILRYAPRADFAKIQSDQVYGVSDRDHNPDCRAPQQRTE